MLENVTGGPKISFQIVQVVSTDGLSQFLIIMQQVEEEDAILKLLIRAGLGTIFA